MLRPEALAIEVMQLPGGSPSRRYPRKNVPVARLIGTTMPSDSRRTRPKAMVREGLLLSVTTHPQKFATQSPACQGGP